MKSKKIPLIAFILVTGVIAWWFLYRPGPRSIRFEATATESSDSVFSYDSYAVALKSNVTDSGMVNYKALKAESRALDDFAASIGDLDSSTYGEWSEKEKIAFLMNTYNALTLEAILTHYPIKPSLTASILYPKNSIRQISGVWDRLDFLAMNRKVTLDGIEHQILRKHFNEPRIHLALVCAAMGCPPLRNEPYTADKLDSQLDDQAERFISNASKFRIDRAKARVHLSSIFKWYGDDFIRSYGTDEKFAGHNKAERAVLNYISKYLNDSDRDYLASGKYEIEYLNYDWSLNEQGEDRP